MLHDSSQIENEPPVIGFYSVVEIESIGYCGGYLLLNEIGRPIEFHCTLPILPERAQKILYGDSLEPFLLGEHIGPPLINKAKTLASFVLVNQRAALNLGRHIDLPVALINQPHGQDSQSESVDPAQTGMIEKWLQTADSINVTEPFERILSAIQEAHTLTRQERQ